MTRLRLHISVALHNLADRLAPRNQEWHLHGETAEGQPVEVTVHAGHGRWTVGPKP